MKRGFTLVELLAVIVILGVISVITYGIISTNMESTRKKSFEVSVKNMIEAAKEYVVDKYEDNDFPAGGIDITDKKIDLKNNNYVSGIIRRDPETNKIVVVNMSDGTFCANGSKGDLEITAGDCSATDETPAETQIKIIKVKDDEATVMLKMQDAQSGIKSYEYCYGEVGAAKICKEVPKNYEKVMQKELIKLGDLKNGVKHQISLKVINGIDMESEVITKEFMTNEMNAPEFKISTNTSSVAKTLTITYPNVSMEQYEFRYILNSEVMDADSSVLVNSNTVDIEVSENSMIAAFVLKRQTGEIAVYDKLHISGIDTEYPLANVIIPDINLWTSYKLIQVDAVDQPLNLGVGLALRAYSYDKEVSWIKSSEKKYTAAQKITVSTRDKLGNKTSKFTVNCDPLNEDCEWFTIYPNGDDDNVLKIDNLSPSVKFEVTRGEKNTPDNEWYINDNVEVTATIVDRASKIVKGEEKVLEEYGIGIDLETLKISINDTDITDLAVCGGTDMKLVCKINVPENGVNNIKIEVSDKNIPTDDGEGYKKEPYPVEATFVVKKDDVRPTIVHNGSVYYNRSITASGIFNSYFTKTYGPSGIATYSCDPDSLTLKNSNVSCTYTTGSGFTVSAATTAPLMCYYPATAYTATCSYQTCGWEGSCDGHYKRTSQSNYHMYWEGGLLFGDTTYKRDPCHSCMDYVCRTHYYTCTLYKCPSGGSLSGTTCYI